MLLVSLQGSVQSAGTKSPLVTDEKLLEKLCETLSEPESSLSPSSHPVCSCLEFST